MLAQALRSIAGALASSDLWEVQTDDPATLIGVAAVLVSIALLPRVKPARSASKVDPTVAPR